MADTDLIERLKEAGGPNFALDILIAQTLVPDIVVMRRNNEDTGNEPFTYRAFTADIGDALWLVETLLPDTFYFFAKGRTRPDEPLFAFQILTGQRVMGDNEVIAEAEHESAPISILLALCTVLSQKEAGGQAVANIVPEGCTGKALAFDPGTLHVNKDGSGYIVVAEDEWQLEEDRCEGPDGPEGSVHWITRLDASEMQALRDFLNGAALSQPHPADEQVVEALRGLLEYVDQTICTHDSTHRGGAIWTICDECGKQWADDEGGFEPYVDPEPVAAARKVLSAKEGR